MGTRDAIDSLPDLTPVWVDRQGRQQPLGAPEQPYVFPNIAPDGERIAFTIFGEKHVENWIYEVQRGILMRLTFAGNEHLPVWSPDGRQLAIASTDTGAPNIWVMAADGSGERRRLTTSDYHQCPSSWSPDGRFLVYGEFRTETEGDLWVADVNGATPPRPFLVTPFNECHGMISPDGKAIAYTSNESGRAEVYARRFPEGWPKVQVSTKGGAQPMWSHDGREVFFWIMDPDEQTGKLVIHRFAAATVNDSRALKFGVPRELFSGHYRDHGAARPNYDVDPRSGRFLMLLDATAVAPLAHIEIEEGLLSRLRGL